MKKEQSRWFLNTNTSNLKTKTQKNMSHALYYNTKTK